jgi:ubiquinone/menaquinone biosynthesis C-methylase UbiE
VAEFTGERVIPGEVEADLWNEHLARYVFAVRYASGRRVLDAGCGAGYGSAELARVASIVVALDASADAVRYGREHYTAPNLHFLQASCAALPIPDASVDLITSFEVIEHLADWQAFLNEARRVLTPTGQLVISTPNKDYYAESRRLTGPNPYHVHEFDFDEFAARLRELSPHVTVYLENHVEAISFDPRNGDATPELSAAGRAADPAAAHFYLAVCSNQAQPPAAPFLYLPSTANILRERELHIERLEGELATKDSWLETLRKEKQNLVDMFRGLTAELERSNQWAHDLDEMLHSAQDRIIQLQEELETTISGYQARVAELESDTRVKTEWAERLQGELDAKGQELLNSIRLLDEAEKTVVERTAWAQRLADELNELQALLNMVRSSRWVRIGRSVGLGPALPRG